MCAHNQVQPAKWNAFTLLMRFESEQWMVNAAGTMPVEVWTRADGGVCLGSTKEDRLNDDVVLEGAIRVGAEV